MSIVEEKRQQTSTEHKRTELVNGKEYIFKKDAVFGFWSIISKNGCILGGNYTSFAEALKGADRLSKVRPIPELRQQKD